MGSQPVFESVFICLFLSPHCTHTHTNTCTHSFSLSFFFSFPLSYITSNHLSHPFSSPLPILSIKESQTSEFTTASQLRRCQNLADWRVFKVIFMAFSTLLGNVQLSKMAGMERGRRRGGMTNDRDFFFLSHKKLWYLSFIWMPRGSDPWFACFTSKRGQRSGDSY